MSNTKQADLKAAQAMKSVALMGGSDRGSIGGAFSALLMTMTSTATALGNVAQAAEVMSGVVLTKAENFAALSELQDQANYSIAKLAVDQRIAALKGVGIAIDIE